MASGLEHSVGYKWGLGVLSATAVVGTAVGVLSVDAGIALVAGGVLGMLVDPDIRDQHNITTHTERRWRKIPVVGWIVAYLWQCYWYPMSRFIPHRSFLSHMPGLGTAIAAVWLIVPWSLLLWLINTGGFSGYLTWLLGLWQPVFWLTFAGWVFQDTIHFAMDGGRIHYRWHKK